MNIRVNLLKQEELRHAGGVSRQFAIRTGSITGVALLVLVLGLWGFKHFSVMRDLKWSKSEWAGIEESYNNILKIQNNFQSRRNTVNELKKWEESRIQWNTPFADLRGVIPDSVQLTKLSIRSRMDIKIPEEEDDPSTVDRHYQILLNGRAAGEMGDEVVLQLVRNLNESDKFQKLLDSVQLKKLQRDTFDQQGGQASLFFIEGIFYPRKIK